MRDNIWFTYKARIQAHTRLAWIDFHSQLLLVWYAILSAGLAVVCIRHPQFLGPDTDIISTVLSVALLAISMAVTNRDFRGRSIEMRRNYLALHDLYRKSSTTGTLSGQEITEYNDLLSAVENHKEIDDKIFRVRNHLTLKDRKPTASEFFQVYWYLTIKFLVVAALYIAPLTLLLYKQ